MEKGGNIINPGVFIPIAEESGMILSIGRWVFEQACKMQSKLKAIYGKNTPYISVNISTRQLDNERIVVEFEEILKKSGADPKDILLELTETSIMSNVDDNLRVLNALNALGMSVAVDDFGTGYSSLLQLLRMPVSHIKIDREFVDGLDKRKDSKLITSAIIKMAKALDKIIIAEGVENQSQLYELSALGADSIQGYYFYRPMDEKRLLETMRDDMMSNKKANNEIYATLYVSKASDGVSIREIEEMLKKARAFNLTNAITGCLIYSNGYFMQLLEGRKEILDSLMLKILKDKRHTDATTIMKGFSKNRVFGDWSMAFWDIDTTKHAGELDVLVQKEMTLKDLAKDPRLCYAMFEGLAR